MPYYCPDCRKEGKPRYFSVTTGSHLESRCLEWDKILLCIYFLAAQREGISAPQIAVYAGIDQTTALDFRRRVAAALPDEPCHAFSGPSEFDESYLGGSQSKRHKKDRKNVSGRQDKLRVLGAVDRPTGHVRLSFAEKVDKKTITAFVRSVSESGSKVYTDGLRVYQTLVGFLHEWVNHGVGEFVREDVHINNVENLFDRLDRALYPLRGVSKERLPGYLLEIQWLRNLADRPILVRVGVILSYLLCTENHETGLTDPGIATGENPRTMLGTPAAAESVEDMAHVQRPAGAEDDESGLPSDLGQRESATVPAITIPATANHNPASRVRNARSKSGTAKNQAPTAQTGQPWQASFLD